MMKWGRKAAWLSILLLLAAAALLSYIFHTRPREPSPVPVSLVALISNPEAFDGKEIVTQGLIRASNDSYRPQLYLHKDDAEHGLTYNSIFVAFDIDISNAAEHRRKYAMLKKYDGQYVVIHGIFRNIIFPVEKTYIKMPTISVIAIERCDVTDEPKSCGSLILIPKESSAEGSRP